MRRSKTYFNRTCHKVAKELNMDPQEVKIIIRSFFKALDKAARSYQRVQIRRFFKTRLKLNHYRRAIYRGVINPEEYAKGQA